MIYGHYDVQPVDQPELAAGEAPHPDLHWMTSPFEPVLKDGLIFARGATDNKGQIFAHISGVVESITKNGDLPVNLIFLIEGEEEVGSDNLEHFLIARKEDLRCDTIAVSDTGMAGDAVPTLTYGLRGIAAMEITVQGPSSDLHSGVFGGTVANPATVLARLLATLHDDKGRIAIEGYYDSVDPLKDWEREAWAKLPFGDNDLLQLTGVSELVGEEGYSGLERTWGRPTAEVNGIGGGFQGHGTKTVIARSAFAKLTFRLVANQQPTAALELASAHLRKHCPPGVKLDIELGHYGEPYVTDPFSSYGQAAQRALREAFPGKEVALIREGGSIPIVNTFRKVLGVETLLVGLARADCRAHAPNENFPVANFEAGIRLNHTLLRELAG